MTERAPTIVNVHTAPEIAADVPAEVMPQPWAGRLSWDTTGHARPGNSLECPIRRRGLADPRPPSLREPQILDQCRDREGKYDQREQAEQAHAPAHSLHAICHHDSLP